MKDCGRRCNNRLWLYLIAIILYSTLFVRVNSYQHEVVKLVNGDYAFIFRRNSSYEELRLIPDLESAQRFPFFDEASIKTLSITEQENIKVGNPVPLLHMNGVVNPDEAIRIVYEKALVLNPPIFRVVSRIPGYFNLAFTKLWNGRVLACWGIKPYKGFTVYCGWFKEGSYSELSQETFMGIGPSTPLIPELGGFAYMEDPRLLAVSGEQVIVELAAVYWSNAVFMKYGTFGLNQSTGVGEFDLTAQVQDHKNWIPLESKDNEIYFISSINPLHVHKMIQRGQSHEPINYAHKAEKPEFLPWDPEFGNSFRGGTPAILVNDLYVSFFHTKAFVELPSQMFTYFMGAITFCPTFPFKVHSISSSPILNGDMYQGPWCQHLPHNQADYVVFPTGIIRDDTDDHILVSVGFQNSELFVLNFTTKELFDSMEVVNEC